MHKNFFWQACSIHQLRKSQEESRQLDHWFRNGKHFNDPRAKKTPGTHRVKATLTLQRVNASVQRFFGHVTKIYVPDWLISSTRPQKTLHARVNALV